MAGIGGQDAQRPDLGFPGVWMQVSSRFRPDGAPNPDLLQGAPAHGGRDRYVALAVELKEITACLIRLAFPHAEQIWTERTFAATRMAMH